MVTRYRLRQTVPVLMSLMMVLAPGSGVLRAETVPDAAKDKVELSDKGKASLDKLKGMLQANKPLTWVFSGDSITEGSYHTFGYRDYSQIFEERVRYELNRPLDVVIKTAHSGWSTEDIRNNIDRCILRFQPEVVFIMIGVNDSNRGIEFLDKFTENYNWIIDQVQSKAGAQVVLQTPDYIGSPVLLKFVERTREIAKQRGLLLIDHYSEWEAAIKEVPWRGHNWYSDCAHPGPFGHRAFARKIFKELGIWDETSTCSKFCVTP